MAREPAPPPSPSLFAEMLRASSLHKSQQQQQQQQQQQ
jgi:hypothetical protein